LERGKKMKKKILINLILFVSFNVLQINNVFPWDNEVTHRDLSKYAADRSSLGKDKGDYLRNVGFNLGLDEVLIWRGENWTATRWLQAGADFEDKSDWGFPAFGTTRSVNHFHNPLKPWGQAGLDDWFILHYTGESSLLWAQDGVRQENYIEGDWSWQKVRDYYYFALTATSDAERQANFAKTFRGLGHQIHLIQDAAQPDHVRNDAHPEDSMGLSYGIGIEKWAKREFQFIKSLASGPFFPQVPLNTSYGGLVPITELFDADRYNGGNPSASLAQGISEYTNANFFSDDTIFAAEVHNVDHRHYFPYPKKSSTDLDDYLAWNKLPETVMGEDGLPETAFWIKKITDGETIEHFLKPLYLSNNIKEIVGVGSLYYRAFYRDERCHEDYAQKLIPRAVGYSAGLLNYFFRGKLEVTAVPVFNKNMIIYLRAKIKNLTPNETMKDGTFTITYSYRPTGRNPDGSEDIWARTPAVVSGTLEYGGDDQHPVEDTVINFLLPTPIPKESYDSAKFTLAFSGTLGNEVGAVIGKVLTLGEVKFNEEWDNGLTANNNWGHVEYNVFGWNPNNGTTTNTIVGDTLIKENNRYMGSVSARVNESFVDYDYNNGQFRDKLPILVTEDTYVQFKIDAMSINQIPPAPPGYSNHWQALILHFSNGLSLQYFQAGQGMYTGPNTVYLTFQLGLVIVDNIYDMFRSAGITIPEPLNLEGISFLQQLFMLDEPSTVYHRQYMEIDSIRIIEGKKQ
jgi:hypothetical protein